MSKPVCTDRSLLAITVACLVLGASGPAVARDEKVVAVGDTLAGSLIQDVSSGRINALGQVAFDAETPASVGTRRIVLLRAANGSFTALASTGVALPGGGTLAAFSSSDLSLGDNGDVALRGGVDVGDPLLVNSSLRASATTGLTEVYRAGDPAPGGTAFGPSEVQMSSLGQVTFRSSFGTNGVSDGFGIFQTRSDESGVDAIVLEGELHEHDGLFGNVGSLIGRTTGNGVAFEAFASFDGLPALRHSIWWGSAGGLQFFARANQALSATTTIQSIGGAATRRGDAGTVIEATLLANGSPLDALLVAGVGHPVSLFNKEGDAEPELGDLYESFATIPQADAFPRIAFRADLASGKVGLFRDAMVSGRAYSVARTGEYAPGEAVNEEHQYITLGSAGAGGFQHIAFDAQVQRDNKIPSEPLLRGVYLAEPDEALRITRTGLMLEQKEVADAHFIEVNQHGQVLYSVEYTDTTQEQRLFTPMLRWRNAGGGNWNGLGNWTLEITPARVHDVRIDPASDLTVTGPSNLGGVRVRTLRVGDGAGVATLELVPDELLRVESAPLNIRVNGRLTGKGVLDGGLVNRGIVQLGTQPNSYFTMISGDVVSTGTVHGSGYFNAPSFTNETGGIVRAAASDTLNAEIDAFANAASALVEIESGGAAIFGGTFLNDGVVDVALGGTATFEGFVSGNGSFTGEGEKVFLGGISPGTSPGALQIDGPSVLGRGAVVVLEVGGTDPGDYDRIVFESVTIQGAALEIRLVGGFVPGANDALALFDWGQRGGEFETVDLPELPDGISWDVAGLYDGEIRAVPEPGATAAALVAWLALAIARRARFSISDNLIIFDT